MRDRPDAQERENLDTHFHHSSTITYARDMALYFLGSEQVKVTLFYVFIFFSTSPLGEDGMGRRHTFSV